MNCSWWILFVFWLQVLLGPDSSPFIRLMLTPTTCPKPIPGVCQTHLQTLSLSCEWKNRIISLLMWTLCLPPSFNRIDIPPYESYDKLYDKLLTAIEETCGFAVEWETRWSVCLCVNMSYCVQDSWKTIIVTATCRQVLSEPDTSLRPACSLPLLSPLSTFFPYRKLSEQLLESHPVIDFLFIFMFFCFVFWCCLCEIRRSY